MFSKVNRYSFLLIDIFIFSKEITLREEVDGDKAVVVCKFGPVEQDVNLRKVDGLWKIDVP